MKWQEGHCGLPFTLKQIEEIGIFLELADFEEAKSAAISIALAAIFYETEYNANKRMGPVHKVSSKLSQIAAAATALAKLLEDETICNPPGSPFWALVGFDEKYKGFDRPPLWKDKSLSRKDVHELVKNISISASFLASHDQIMRGYYFLPLLRDATQNLVTSCIWPTLFIVWEQHGRRLGGSVNGTNPLHRFVRLVHTALGLSEPNTNTLNRAIQRWKIDPRRNRAENAAWYFRNSPENSGVM